MNLVQIYDKDGHRRVAMVEEGGEALHLLEGVEWLHKLALRAVEEGKLLHELVRELLSNERANYAEVVAEKRLLPPLDHPDPAHLLVSLTGLTHLGSANARDGMHSKLINEDKLTDSMRIFKWGLEGGKPPREQIGVQPEWCYKGRGDIVVAPERELELPRFADSGGEEAEIAGLYVISSKGKPYRVGFALGNEFSDHAMEKVNYLYLAHSKLRSCSYGPEVRLGDLPPSIEGQVRIVRDGRTYWEGTFLTGEENMTHSLANLEHHHFKYTAHRQPGDVHVHFFGAATLSFSSNISTQPGDIFEISAPMFGRPLRNQLVNGSLQELVRVESL